MKTFLLALIFLAVAGSAFASSVEYPLGGNFQTEEGTIEIWFTPTEAELFPADDGQYHSVLSFFSIKVAGEWNIGTGLYRHKSQIGVKASMGSARVPDGIIAILPDGLPDWKTGRPQRLAFTWKGRDMKIIADGKVIGSREQVVPFSGDMAGQKIIFGGKSDKMVLHAVRISSIARTPEELGVDEPVEDRYTLLLDKFDKPIEGGATTPVVSFGLGDKTKGTVNGKVDFVAEPVPGISLAR